MTGTGQALSAVRERHRFSLEPNAAARARRWRRRTLSALEAV